MIEIHHPSHAAIPVDHPPHSDDTHYSCISVASPAPAPAPAPATFVSLVLTGTLPYSKEPLRPSQHDRVKKCWDPTQRTRISNNAETRKMERWEDRLGCPAGLLTNDRIALTSGRLHGLRNAIHTRRAAHCAVSLTNTPRCGPGHSRRDDTHIQPGS
jgi:hypothetical protein